MSLLRSIVAAFSCFSAIPMPHVRWDERDMRYMMAAFPLVGVVVGALMLLWMWVTERLGLGTMARAIGLTLIPVVVSGGIHMDGLADVIDAQSSHAEPERRRQILKDPHVGAFAVIGVACYLLAFAGLASEVTARLVGLIACVPVVSRCVSGLAVVCMQPARKQGMYATADKTAHKPVVRALLVAELCAAAAAMIVLSPACGGCALLAAVAALAYVRWLANRHYGGMSGDLAGYYLQIAELAMLASIVLMGRVA